MLEVNDDIVIHYNNKNMYIKLIRYIMKKTGRVRILEIRIILLLHLLLVQRMIIIIKRYILHI